jgi:hypothetical protein
MQSSCREAIICADWVRRRIKATALITTVCSQLQLFVALAQKGADAVERSRSRDVSTKIVSACLKKLQLVLIKKLCGEELLP